MHARTHTKFGWLGLRGHVAAAARTAEEQVLRGQSLCSSACASAATALAKSQPFQCRFVACVPCSTLPFQWDKPLAAAVPWKATPETQSIRFSTQVGKLDRTGLLKRCICRLLLLFSHVLTTSHRIIAHHQPLFFWPGSALHPCAPCAPCASIFHRVVTRQRDGRISTSPYLYITQ